MTDQNLNEILDQMPADDAAEEDVFDSWDGFDDDVGDIDFPDEADQPDTDEAEGQAAQTGGEEAPTKDAQTEPKPDAEAKDTQTESIDAVEVVHNGQPVAVSPEEIKPTLQKGLNYDHVKGELDRLRGDEGYKLIDDLAGMAGKTRAEYVQMVRQQLEQAQRQRFMDQGMTETEARAQMGKDAEITRLKEENQKLQALREQKAQSDSRMLKYMDFIKQFPDVDPKKLPPEVLEESAKGGDLTAAYLKYENRRLKEAMEQKAHEEKVRRRAPGSAKGQAPMQEELDAFLSGLNS